MFLRNGLAFLALIASCSTDARAGLIIDVQDAGLTAGSSGIIDVYIRSSGTDHVNIFDLTFQISGTHPSGSLRFGQVQSNVVQQATGPDYIFLNASSEANFGYARQDPTVTRLSGGDKRSTGSTSIGNSNLLLARLGIEHVTPTPSTATGVYQVSLVVDESQFGGPSSVTIQSSSAGTITVTSVPEPSSLILILGATSMFFRKRRLSPTWIWNWRMPR